METSTGSIRQKGQSVIFEFWLKKGETYVIDLRGDGERPLRDPALNVIGDSGQFAEDDNGGAHKNAQLFFAPSKSEFYEVSVFDSTGGTGDFTLDVNADDFRNRPSGVAPSGLVATDARPARGEVNYDGDTDAFATHLIAGLSYNLRLRSAGDDGTKDPALTLLAADGHALASSEDFGWADLIPCPHDGRLLAPGSGRRSRHRGIRALRQRRARQPVDRPGRRN